MGHAFSGNNYHLALFSLCMCIGGLLLCTFDKLYGVGNNEPLELLYILVIISENEFDTLETRENIRYTPQTNGLSLIATAMFSRKRNMMKGYRCYYSQSFFMFLRSIR
ncbi:hypothetical protein ACJX0J_006726 [Zea mays]